MFPVTYRGAAPDDVGQRISQAASQQQPSTADQRQLRQSLGDEKWWEVFQDNELQGLIRTALKNNYDVRIAATRVLQAQAQLGITRADQFPIARASAATSPASRIPQIGPIPVV